jgi:sulfite exporter TauE/SafE
MNQVFLAFVTGLTTGGLSCFAVQGGLLAGILAGQKKDVQKKTVLMFLGAKLISHLVLGAGLGFLGASLFISPKVQGVMQIFAGIFMIATALKLSDAHPLFRKLTLTPPKGFFKILRIQSKNEGFFAPILLGLLTILIPCGTTQAMMLLSVSSANPFWGALILGSFILGTSPIFFAMGVASEKILSYKSLKIAAVLLITYLGFTSINSGQILRGSAHTFQNYKSVLFAEKNSKADVGLPKIQDGKQLVTIDVKNTAYKADAKYIKINVPVKLTLITKNTMGCSRAFTIPSFNIFKMLPASGVETVEFTPTKLGKLTYACSMGMYTGSFNVVE